MRATVEPGGYGIVGFAIRERQVGGANIAASRAREKNALEPEIATGKRGGTIDLKIHLSVPLITGRPAVVEALHGGDELLCRREVYRIQRRIHA
ncbi:MAG TPA: hypothetical protein VGV35_19700, partial [Bryobacteraceae bacterium]|nr:hypothetical protein [Bryobacteraceae bacterium]